MPSFTARLASRWRDIPIAKKLYAVIGVMAFLIVGELLTLWFAMSTLSAVRAFVAGEGLWSKAQKDAVFSLQRYVFTSEESDYADFLGYLAVCEGDRRARTELARPHPDLEVVREGFLAGRNHPDDIAKMTQLLLRFESIGYIREAIEAWADADLLLVELQRYGREYREEVRARGPDPERRIVMLEKIQVFNENLTLLEDRFSHVLGEGSRWLEAVIITALSLLVLTVETVGLMLAFLTSRSLSGGLSEISAAATAIGLGDFDRRVPVRGRDEIGILAEAINRMGETLRSSYTALEGRVEARTHELAKAVQARDEFLSLASHELRTPVTSMSLQIELRKTLLGSGDLSHFTPEKLQKMLLADERQIKRLSRLIEDMLDISRIGARKMHIEKEAFNLAETTQSVVDRFLPSFQAANCQITLRSEADVPAYGDPSRIEQILENLLTNALKYGQGKPVTVSCRTENGQACLSVVDQGRGIAADDQERIFQPFERVRSEYGITGLGLGLYIARQIASLNGGHLEVQSEVGQGSAFRLRIPGSNI